MAAPLAEAPHTGVQTPIPLRVTHIRRTERRRVETDEGEDRLVRGAATRLLRLGLREATTPLLVTGLRRAIPPGADDVVRLMAACPARVPRRTPPGRRLT